jgi:ankyrin repeat protein
MELFVCCEKHGVDAFVNHADMNGDTALQAAMIESNLNAVKLLLEKGADALGSGYQDTTALMKPFLDNEALRSEYDLQQWQLSSGTYRSFMKDADINTSLKVVLNAVLLRGAGGGTGRQRC